MMLYPLRRCGPGRLVRVPDRIQHFLTSPPESLYSRHGQVCYLTVIILETVMLDIAGILFSSVMILFVIVRAVQLDRNQPWFQTIARKDELGKSALQPWRRSG